MTETSFTEAERQAALDALQILDTPSSVDFDIFPELAAQIFRTPIAAISLVDRNRQWFKASVGLDVTETSRDVSFCAHAIQRPDEVLYVPDATKDPRFAGNPLVGGEVQLRFYAGAPIIGPAGHPVGAMCIIDREAREMSEDELKQLQMLAVGVSSALKRHSAEQESRKRELGQGMMQAMLASVFKNVDAAVAIMRTTILLANPAFTKMLGYPAGALGKMTLKDLTWPQCHSAMDAAEALQVSTGESFELDIVVLRKGGEHLPVRLTSALTQRSGMQPFRVVTLCPLPGRPVAAAALMTQVLAGSIELLRLDSVKAAYGPRWEEVRTRLMLEAERILKRRLRPTDVYSRTNDDGFSIWFKEGTEEDNAARIARIGREIRIMLLGEFGEESPCSVGSYTQVAEVSDPNAPVSVVMDGLTQRLAERRREAEQQARELLEEVVRDQPRELTPVSSSSGQVVDWAFIDLPRALLGRFEGAMSLVGGPNGEIEAELLRLGLAAQSLMEDSAQGKGGTRLIAVSAALFLRRQAREQFIKQWRTFGPAVGPRLFIMLSGVPRDVSPGRLTEAVRMLQSMTKGVGVLLEQIEPLPFDMTTCPFGIVGFSSEAACAVPEAKLRSFVLRARQAKARLLVRLGAGESPRRWGTLGVDLTTSA